MGIFLYLWLYSYHHHSLKRLIFYVGVGRRKKSVEERRKKNWKEWNVVCQSSLYFVADDEYKWTSKHLVYHSWHHKLWMLTIVVVIYDSLVDIRCSKKKKTVVKNDAIWCFFILIDWSFVKEKRNWKAKEKFEVKINSLKWCFPIEYFISFLIS